MPESPKADLHRYLSFCECEEIAILHAQQLGVREIARRVGRSPSTISRELRRNASTRSHSAPYRATTARWHAERHDDWLNLWARHFGESGIQVLAEELRRLPWNARTDSKDEHALANRSVTSRFST
jgi:transposase